MIIKAKPSGNPNSAGENVDLFDGDNDYLGQIIFFGTDHRIQLNCNHQDKRKDL